MNVFDRYVGIPYLEHGRSIVGLDCWGLVWLVYRELRGIELPSYAERYVTLADRKAIADLVNDVLPAWQEVAPGQEHIFDACLMREGRLPTHVGVVAAPGRVLHVDRGETSRIENYRGGLLSSRVVGFYRYREHA